MKKSAGIIFHSLSKDDVVSALETDPHKGLSDEEVHRRLKQFGKNRITEKKKISPLYIFLSQFKSPIVFLLFFAATLSFWFKEYLDGFAIVIVVLINAAIGFYMEYKAEQSMQALKKLSTAPAKVYRKNKLAEINSENIVPGDLVFVEAGDLVPADGRIYNLSQLQADESALTGESIPVEKQVDSLPKEKILAERANMLYKGTFISKGNANIIITGTGMNTELGNVAGLVQSAKQSVTPLEKKLENFSKKLIKVTVLLVVLIFAAGLLSGQKIIDMLQTSIALAVAAIPEGLPIVATVALAQGMIKMARHKVIVKKLSAVETLGGTSVICTDKTGTLTENKIMVKEIYPVTKNEETIIRDISILCNTAEIYKEGKEIKEMGDPLEIGLLKYFTKNDEEIVAYRKKFPKIQEEPFSSETKIMSTLHKTENRFTVYAKGAVEELIQRCTKIPDASGEAEVNDKLRDKWLKEAEKVSSLGMRVIAVGYKRSNTEETDLTSGLVFAGLIGMIDPPRKDVFKAIEECHSAGINIIMITGDHPSTAKSIAEQLHITNEKSLEVIVGKNMKHYDELSEEDKNTWANTHVFARVSPKQKIDIVSVLQEKKFVVGMTGDGINDAPALKKADIGIAMGQRGTQVAQEVADMIIKDDAFSSIVLAVKQGRVIFENIRKFVIYLLSCNVSELLVISIAAVFNLHFQLFPLQILFINIITDVLPALALGITEGSQGIMTVPPRKESEPIIDKKRWQAIIFYSIVICVTSVGGVFFSHYILNKNEEWNAQSGNNILFFSLIFSQLLHVFNMARTGVNFFKSEVFKNKFVWLAVFSSFSILFILYFIAPSRKVLSLYPMSPQDWLVTISSAIITMIIIQTARTLKIIKH